MFSFDEYLIFLYIKVAFFQSLGGSICTSSVSTVAKVISCAWLDSSTSVALARICFDITILIIVWILYSFIAKFI